MEISILEVNRRNDPCDGLGLLGQGQQLLIKIVIIIFGDSPFEIRKTNIGCRATIPGPLRNYVNVRIRVCPDRKRILFVRSNRRGNLWVNLKVID